MKPGDTRANFLSIGTYPQTDAFSVLKATAKKQGQATIKLAGGGLAFSDKTHPTSVYLAYPGSDYQIEVFDPSSARARRLVVSGKVVPIGIPTAGHAAAKAVSPAQIKSLAKQAGHPIFWAGAKAKMTYEYTQTSDGRIYIRYLPAGIKVGDVKPDYLTIGTYPETGALAKLKATTTKTGAESLKLAEGGLASIDKNKPTSVYVAYPGSDSQIEVYDPAAAKARAVVTSGQLVPLG